MCRSAWLEFCCSYIVPLDYKLTQLLAGPSWILLTRTHVNCMQDVNGSLYVYHEVLEGCGELVQPTEYTALGQACCSIIHSPIPMDISRAILPATKEPPYMT